MIKAIIFDVGGVLVRTEDPSFRQKLEANHNLAAGDAEYLVFNSEMGRKAQHGEITTAELWTWVAAHLSLDDETLADFQRDFFAGDQLDLEMVDFVHRLQESYIYPEKPCTTSPKAEMGQNFSGELYQTAIISNAADNLLENVTEVYPMASAFGLIVGSAYEGIMKPDPTIFMRTLERLDRQPNEAVFIDDFLHNVDAARALGMEAIHFQPGTDLPQELADLGVRI